MTTFRVWAPFADRVDLDLSGRAVPMREHGRGWWEADVPEAGPGTDYAFRLDGGKPLPDPRSPWQPEGVQGPSRTVDHDAFRWSDDAWRGIDLKDVVLYELHVGTFSADGTFDGAIEHLDHLVDLGVTAVELLPVAEFSGSRGWGYDGVDLYAPHSGYGGPDGLKRLVDACHARGIGVVLDVVYNHLGPEGNYLGSFGPYFTDFFSTPWGQAVNYDRPGSDDVRRFVIDNALMWLRDYHVDGLRLDAVHAIIDTSAVHVLEQMADEVHELGRELRKPLFLVAESDLNDPRLLRSSDVGGYGLDAQWSDDFHHALRTALTGEREGYYEDYEGLPDLAHVFEHTWKFQGSWSETRGRTHGRPHGGLPGWHFLAYCQNHDQVGNRAIGDRLSDTQPQGRLKIAAALYLLSPFVPMVFQGEEWGASTPFQYFTSHSDPELGRAVAQGRRSEFRAFGWQPEDVPNPQEAETFERSKLDWAEPGKAEHADLLRWYRDLIALRRATPELAAGAVDAVQHDPEAQTITVVRGPFTIAANLGEAAWSAGLSGGVVLASGPDASGATLPPDSVVVVRTG